MIQRLGAGRDRAPHQGFINAKRIQRVNAEVPKHTLKIGGA